LHTIFLYGRAGIFCLPSNIRLKPTVVLPASGSHAGF
jgi:hypothetical protein